MAVAGDSMESQEDQIVNELVTLGIMRHKHGQLMLSENFFIVMGGEKVMSDGDVRKRIMQAVYQFAPLLERKRVLTYVAILEGYFLQN